MQVVPGIKVTTSGFNSRADSDSETLRSTAVLRKVRSSLVTRVRKGIQADGGHFEKFA